MIIINNIKMPITTSESEAIQEGIVKLNIDKSMIKESFIHKMSVDARGIIKFVYSVGVVLIDETVEDTFANIDKDIVVKKQKSIEILRGEKPLENPPVICGIGPAGLFCGLILAKQGLAPVIIEQGEDIDSRTKAVDKFYKTGKLNPLSNVQFGEGGAGTFSDGKLTTRIGDERCGYVIDTLVEHGAPKDIKFAARPHIGTDLLTGVIKSIRNEIIALGGQVLFNTKLLDISVKNGEIASVITSNGEIPTGLLIMATGHSARDAFYMMKNKGIYMQGKPFSVGVRIESLQSEIEKGLYHIAAGNKLLPKGEYQLSTTVKDRGVYTFCMCPGGEVVAAASEENSVTLNGMSRHARDGKNANSALVVSVNPKDFGNSFEAAIDFQRGLEQKAFQAAGKGYKAPAQTVDSFLKGTGGLNIKSVEPTYPLGIVEAPLSKILPKNITDGLKTSLVAFNRKLRGFGEMDNILTGVETRTSSPVRVIRDDGYESNIKGLYPCGEGAGYAGGIMSAAVDGIRVAQQISSIYKIKK